MRAEVLALWGHLWFSRCLSIDSLNVYGGLTGAYRRDDDEFRFLSPHLTARISQIKLLRRSFISITFQHIFWEKNWIADTLSKKGLPVNSGYMHYSLLESDTIRAGGLSPSPDLFLVLILIIF